MANQVSPGIVLKERDLSNAVVVGAQQITAAYASTFRQGPIGKIVNINSQRELINIFGTPTEANAEDWFVASEFLSYGGRLSVVRAQTGVLNATSGVGTLIKSNEDWDAGTGSSLKFAARSAGKWANNLKVVVVDRGADQYVTFSQVPAGISAGDTLTFTGGQTALVYAWDQAAKKAALVLDTPTDRITTSDTLDTPDLGVVSTTSNLSGGTGYTAANGVATTGGGGTGLTVNTSVNVGATNGITLVAGGSTYAGSATGVATTGGTGTGLTVNITVVAGAVTAVQVNSPGTGYTVGNTITISTGGANATFTIASVTGAVSSIAVANGGAGYEVNDTITISGGATPATFKVASVINGTITVVEVLDWYSNTDITGTGLKLGTIGPRPGTSEFASNKGISYDEVHIAVIDVTGDFTGSANTVVERLTYLSKLSDARSTEGAATYYKDVINLQSSYIFNGVAPSATTNPATNVVGDAWGQASTSMSSGDKFLLVGKDETSLTGGTDDYQYTNAEIADAYDLFLDTEETTVDFVLMGGSMGTETDTKAKAQKVVSIAASRKDCIAFVSPHKANQVGSNGVLSQTLQRENTINFFTGITSTSYAIFDSGYKYFYDRFNDKYRYIPCNGDVAGLCVSTSATLDDWFSPAGLNRGAVRNAIKLAYNPKKADRDELYQNRINPIVSFPGSGVTLFGDKTALASPSAFDRINVRRLFLNLEKRVGNLAKQVLFEQNDDTTRSSFASAVNSYLSEVQARRGITDFLVVCDESNNTPDVIDRNEFVAELYIKPTRSINFITVTFTATKTGVSFAEVIGR